MTALLRTSRRALPIACCTILLAAGVAHSRPVGFWAMDEGSGITVRDTSEFWNDGILSGPTWCEGKVGSALQFGGTGADTFVEVADDEALRLDGPFTVQFWWNKTSSTVQILFRKARSTETTNYYAYLEGGLHFAVAARDGQTYGVTAPAPPDGWHHMAFSYDGEALTICVDEQVVGSTNIGPVRLASDDSPLLLGTCYPGYKYCLAGVMDEFCISDEALPPEGLKQELAQARSLQRRQIRVETFEPTSGALVVAKDGKPGATIVIPRNASHLQIVPAKALRTYLQRITGARLPIREDSEDIIGNLILVGPGRLTREMGIAAEALTGDSFVIKTAPGRLALLGNDQVMAGDEAFAFSPGRCKWGTSNAVYAFLHGYCGVRWFMPGSLGEVVPKSPTLEAPVIDIRETPQRTYALGSPWNGASSAWSRRNLGGSAVFIRHPGGHLWYSLMPESRYAADHPEWFALLDGQRSGKGNHLCTSNREMFAQALTSLRDLYDQGYEWVELAQTDGYQRCRCAACEAMDEYRDPSGYWLPETPADRIHSFHRELMEQIRKSHPGRMAVIIAYGPSAAVPRAFASFPDNVAIEFTHDPPELLAAWNRFHSRFTAYVYWFGTYHRMGYGPKSAPQYVASELRRIEAAGAEAFYFCGGFECWGVEAPSYYVALQLMRNPQLSETALVSEFCTGLFGSAGPAMERFFGAFFTAAARYRQTEAPQVIPGVPYSGKSRSHSEVYLDCFDNAALEACGRYLDAANAAAPDDDTRRRIRLFRDGFEYMRLTTLAFRRAEELADQEGADARAALDDILKRREAFVDELLARQMTSRGDLPPVFQASREQLLFGPSGEYESAFGDATEGSEE